MRAKGRGGGGGGYPIPKKWKIGSGFLIRYCAVITLNRRESGFAMDVGKEFLGSSTIHGLSHILSAKVSTQPIALIFN